MTWITASTKDPLLFVHRRQSLQAIEFRTARFSPEYVRRRIRQTIIALGAALAFAVIAAYGVLDATQFAAVDGNAIVVRKGHPRLSLPGYPQLVWVADYGPERLTAQAAASLPIVGGLGEKLATRLEGLARRDYVAAARADQGNSGEARSITLTILDDPAASPEQRLNASLVFATVATRDDCG
ncbi:hypothetical protein NKH60_33415 [Mesorhizobium sp. M1006]|uniref:hypothetical protein n=1 Tax=Mesorhizobium sp. M1006 TaxID=2957048 RepID=UPI00333B1CB5